MSGGAKIWMIRSSRIACCVFWQVKRMRHLILELNAELRLLRGLSASRNKLPGRCPHRGGERSRGPIHLTNQCKQSPHRIRMMLARWGQFMWGWHTEKRDARLEGLGMLARWFSFSNWRARLGPKTWWCVASCATLNKGPYRYCAVGLVEWGACN